MPTKRETAPIAEENIMLLEYLDQTLVTYQEITRRTKKDKLLKQVLNYVKNGWPDKCPDTEGWHPYFIRRHELGIVEECLLWGRRVIVLIQGRKKTFRGAPWRTSRNCKRERAEKKLFLVAKIRLGKSIEGEKLLWLSTSQWNATNRPFTSLGNSRRGLVETPHRLCKPI